MNKRIIRLFDNSIKKAVFSLLFFLVLLIIPVVMRAAGFENEAYVEGIIILCMLWAAMTLSWNLLMGYTGIWSLAQQVFFGIAAYTSSMMNVYLGISPWWGFIFGPLAAAVVGLIVAIPVLRLKAAPYIIIATMCLAEIVRLVFTNLVEYTKGELGFWEMDAFSDIGSIDFRGADKMPYYYLIFIIFAVISLICAIISKSSFGLSLKAIRDSQDAAESLGVNITRTKIKVFVISAYMAGFCGVFFAHYMKILTPTNMFGSGMMNEFIAMDVFGGIATVRGPIFGAFFLTIIMESLQGVAEYKLLIYAVILIVMTLLLPSGVLNSKEEIHKIVSGFRKKSIGNKTGKGE